MTTDCKALCAELLEIIDFLCEGDSRPDCDIVARARAYLAQSDPEELTEEEILQISDQFDINGTEDVTKGMPLDTFFDSYQPQQLIAFARALIAADRATTQGVKK